MSQGVPDGNFDLAHLKAIHKHIFQDVYEWAGEIRTLEIRKGNSQFQFASYIEIGIQSVHERLKASRFLKGTSAEEFANKAGEIIGDINYAHPFREGNGRTQLQFLQKLASHAGHVVDPGRLTKDRWIAASKAAHMANYQPMASAILEEAMVMPNVSLSSMLRRPNDAADSPRSRDKGPER